MPPDPDTIARLCNVIADSLRGNLHLLCMELAGGAAYAAPKPAPAAEPREPDGWMVVFDDEREGVRFLAAGAGWTIGECNAEDTARRAAAEIKGRTARPFWLDAPPADTARTVANRLDTRLTQVRNALRAAGVPAVVGYPDEPCDEREMSLRSGGRALQEPERIERLAAERDAAREEIAEAHAMVDASAEAAIGPGRLAERIDALDTQTEAIARRQERAAAQRLYSDIRRERDEARRERLAATDEVARLIREHEAALALARQCRDVALGERGRCADRLRHFDGTSALAHLVLALDAPTLPEVP
jgi:hypothetical protein